MTPNQIFSIVNAVAAGTWLLLAVFPRRRWAATGVATTVPALLAAVYIAIIVTTWSESAGGFSSFRTSPRSSATHGYCSPGGSIISPSIC